MSWTNIPDNLPQWPLDLALSRFSKAHHGDFEKWAAALNSLPVLSNPKVHYQDTVTIDGDLDRELLERALRVLHPWRKGPFAIGGVTIDTEWRSDWKWQRIASQLANLHGQRILDIGCGNGYFGWQMLANGADEVVGIDPTLLFCMQHQAIQHYTQDPRNWVLPLKIEEIPATAQFDTVLSMGVIYHRRDPIQHTQQLAGLTKPGGCVVLESLVVNGTEDLVPQSHYARMRNVWCVPSVQRMQAWLLDAGLCDVTVVDITTTTIEEQRRTPWMHFESLQQALDPKDPNKTIEGYPAPVRAVISARKPNGFGASGR